MIWLILLPLGFVLGAVVGHEVNRKKIVPELKFVVGEQKENVLKQNNITLNENSVCSVCQKKVTKENLGMMIPSQEGYRLVCSDERCMAVSNINPE